MCIYVHFTDDRHLSVHIINDLGLSFLLIDEL